jgi:hypothetical protein
MWINNQADEALAKSGIWISCEEAMPKDGLTVLTKVEDERGLRNIQKLKLNGRLWWLADGSMYVYYRPTHWQLSEFEVIDLKQKAETK